ncbi:glycosyltransferase family 2 protein [Synechococcus sp. CBW1004]|uniref:glycosyltransferase family 2 protein n=1 Tax=Synechococcus sp. CBW1004 TaxID=1353136 RepID=UPI0018CF6AC6|nr:glycosyltransferase family 2 protein [Synechococcus sp. CBW1004]QPN63168.1 glycosyltransferase family 2 protein [Synechococcus sp. CBW1004]
MLENLSGEMPLVATLLCRNEIDIIRANLDFHFALGVDAFIVTDNASIDGTYELLEAYAETRPLILIRESELTHDQGRWVTTMAALAQAEFGPCWLIHTDADEFWLPDTGNLRNYFMAVPSALQALSVSRNNMLPPLPFSSSPESIFYLSMIIQDTQSLNSLGRPLPGKICHRSHQFVTVGDGNHHISIDGAVIRPASAEGLQIIHYPVRSLSQLERKIRDGSAALARNPDLPASCGATWRVLGETLRREGTLMPYYQSLIPSKDELSSLIASGRYRYQLRVRDIIEAARTS